MSAAAFGAQTARAPLDERAGLAGYRAYVDESFEVWGGQGVRLVETLKLVEVKDAGSDDRIQQFVLRFRAAPESTLAKESYRFRHPEAGEFSLWLEPAGRDGSGRIFEARFSLLVGEVATPPQRTRR